MSLSNRVARFFAADGPLARTFPEYSPRSGQLQLAQAVAEALESGHHLAAEAGTGIGKSFAYLVPALLRANRKRPVVVSTATIALQEQLVDKDLPALALAAERPFKAVLAKGRGNYLCETRLQAALAHRDALAASEEDHEALDRLAERAARGGILTHSDLPLPLSHETWHHLNSESGLCGGPVCRKRPCSYLAARAGLAGADVIVVNHSLLFVSLELAAAGVKLLPAFEHLILDEAQHVPDTASEQAGLEASNARVTFLLDRLLSRKNKGFLARVRPEPLVLKNRVGSLRDIYDVFFSGLMMWRLQSPGNGRLVAPHPFRDPLSPALGELSELLENWARSADNADEQNEFVHYAALAKELAADIGVFLTQGLQESAYWVEVDTPRSTGARRVAARGAPLDIAPRLRALLFEKFRSVIMTSATLTAPGGPPFDYFLKRMGAEGVPTLRVPSPFDYFSKARILTTRVLPAPDRPEYLDVLPQQVSRCMDLTDGGAFVLVTSYTLLRRLKEALEPHARERGYLLLAQGQGTPRSRMLKSFKTHPRAVLLGAMSFWEGVDVPGSALRNVIITRLPFEVPDHPLAEARAERLRQRGGDPFREIALPVALMRLKQGFGRLHRRADDMGLVCILDSRVHTRPYGRLFLEGLPPCPVLCDEPPDPEFLERLRSWTASQQAGPETRI